MSGRIQCASVNDIRKSHDPGQSTLSQYGTNTHDTTIAIVRLPRDSDICDVCDEWEPALGMPEKNLERFLKIRAKYRMNSAIDNPGNVAYDELRLDHVYRNYITESDKAQKAIDSIVRRVRDGENITLVCFEEEGERCHRHVLQQIIETRVSRNLTL